MGVERIHFRLGMDLGAFCPWMAREKIGLYVYRDLASYVNGEFNPPPWSNGVAVYAKKAVAIPAMKETSQMLRVLGHETTHLLFVNYFREDHRDPPSWLNEGLAMLEETDSTSRPETSQWYQSMVELDPKRWFPMGEFLAVNPTKDLHGDKSRVGEWYVQAYSVTHFLMRTHSHLQFKSFCAAIRGGKSSEEALRGVYHFRNLADFQHQWRLWLADPAHKRRVAALKSAELSSSDGVVEKAGRGNSPFHGFSEGWNVNTRSVFPSGSKSLQGQP